MWYLKPDTLLLMLAAAVVFALARHCFPEKRLTTWLLVFDLALLVYVDWQLAVFYALYTVFSWVLVQVMGKVVRARKFWFVTLCLLDVVPFFYARLAGFFPTLPALFVLIGFSYNMLKAVDAIFYTYYAEEKVPFLPYANFLLFFPVITGGPIYRYRDFQKLYHTPKALTAPVTQDCVKRFIRGMFKKLVLAAVAQQLLNRVLQMYPHFYVSGALAVLSYGILYFDMAGYADVAISVSTLMGIPAPENFKEPWTAASFTQFWRKWHVTLSDWIREHIFVVVGGKRLNKYVSAAIGLCTMLVMSLWHEFALMALATGVYMGFFLAVENIFGLTTADKRKTNKYVYTLRCLVVNGLFAINAMFFTMNGTQILQALRGFFRL